MKKNNFSDKRAIAWLKENMKGSRLTMALLLTSCLIHSAVTVLMALLIKDVINYAVIGDGVKLLNRSIFAVSAVVTQILLSLLNSYLRERLRFKLEIKLKQNLFEKILKKEYKFITSYHSGELLNRMFSDNVIIAEIASSFLPNIVSVVSKLIFAFVALFSLALEFTVLLLVGGLFIVLFSFSIRKITKKMHKRTQEADGKVRSYMQESVENILAVKVFSNEDATVEKANALQKNYYGKRIAQRKLFIIANTGLHLVFSVVYVLAVIYGAYGIINDTGMDYGTLTAMLQLVTQIQYPLLSIGGVLPQFYNMTASIERIMEIEDIANEPDAVEINPTEFYSSLKAIEFDGVTFSYGRDTVLENSSITINKGDFVCIKGISGIGKSTLFKLLLGVYPDYQGKIAYITENGEIEPNKAIRKLYSFVPQGNLLFSGSLKENLTFVKKDATDEEIEKALKLACAYDFVKELPNGIDTIIGEKGLGLSEGQTQRIAIARALLVNAPILLFDEATSALDEKSELALLENLKTLDGVTLIIISHKKAAESFCNRTLEVVNKRITEV